MQDQFAVGVGAKAMLKLALADPDGRLNARLSKAQDAVILMPDFHAHKRLMVSRPWVGLTVSRTFTG